MIRIIMAIFLLSSIQSHAAEKWKISDFQGYFHFSVDIPGLYFKGELNMNSNDLSCTYQSVNFYKAGPVQSCTFTLSENKLRIKGTESGPIRNVTIDLTTTNRQRVLESAMESDPNEESLGTEILFGSRAFFQIDGRGEVPFRFIKIEKSFFARD